MTDSHDNAQKLRSLTRRAVVHAINDNGAGQTVTVEAHAGCPRSDVPVHQPFGFSSHAPVRGALTHVIPLGGDEADLMALPPANPSTGHMGGLSEGESVLYDAVGQAVYLQDGRIIRVQAATEMTIEIGGEVVLDLTADLATLNVPLKVKGGIQASEDIVAGKISLQNHSHGGVQAGSASTGAPQA